MLLFSPATFFSFDNFPLTLLLFLFSSSFSLLLVPYFFLHQSLIEQPSQTPTFVEHLIISVCRTEQQSKVALSFAAPSYPLLHQHNHQILNNITMPSLRTLFLSSIAVAGVANGMLSSLYLSDRLLFVKLEALNFIAAFPRPLISYH